MNAPIRALVNMLDQAAVPAFAPGTRVRLRRRPDDTGVVLGPGMMSGQVKVRWDEPDEMTHCDARRLEAVSA